MTDQTRPTFTAADTRTYEGFPEGVSDGFIRHAAVATSQYGTTARALAAELLIVRQQAAEQAEQIAQIQQALIAWQGFLPPQFLAAFRAILDAADRET